jgi:hypothetical protein
MKRSRFKNRRINKFNQFKIFLKPFGKESMQVKHNLVRLTILGLTI